MPNTPLAIIRARDSGFTAFAEALTTEYARELSRQSPILGHSMPISGDLAPKSKQVGAQPFARPAAVEPFQLERRPHG